MHRISVLHDNAECYVVQVSRITTQ